MIWAQSTELDQQVLKKYYVLSVILKDKGNFILSLWLWTAELIMPTKLASSLTHKEGLRYKPSGAAVVGWLAAAAA